MVRAEDKTIECMGCGQMLVLSGYNTTVCPACGIVHHEFQRTLYEGLLAFKEWCDRLKAAGKNPDDCIDKLGRLLRLSDLKEQRVVSLNIGTLPIFS